eukprot:UN17783
MSYTSTCFQSLSASTSTPLITRSSDAWQFIPPRLNDSEDLDYFSKHFESSLFKCFQDEEIQQRCKNSMLLIQVFFEFLSLKIR